MQYRSHVNVTQITHEDWTSPDRNRTQRLLPLPIIRNTYQNRINEYKREIAFIKFPKKRSIFEIKNLFSFPWVNQTFLSVLRVLFVKKI